MGLLYKDRRMRQAWSVPAPKRVALRNGVATTPRAGRRLPRGNQMGGRELKATRTTDSNQPDPTGAKGSWGVTSTTTS